MRIASAAGALVAVAATACCRPCGPRPEGPPPTGATYFHDGEDGDIRGGRAENVFAAPGETIAVHDVRDLEARRGFDRTIAVRALREAAPSATIQWEPGRVVASGPDLAQSAVVAWLGRTRAGAPAAAAAGPPPVRLKYFDVRDLVGPHPPEVALAPSSTTSESPAEAPTPPEWPGLADLRAVAPSTEIRQVRTIVVARGPADELAAITRHLEALRAAGSPPK